jgi:hypothetical protein
MAPSRIKQGERRADRSGQPASGPRSGPFAVGGWAPAGLLDTYHRERHFAGARALLQTQAQVALRRGQDPAAHALRKLVLELLVDEQPLRRLGALIAGAHVRYPMPGLSQHPMAGTFAPDHAVRTGKGTTSVAELMPTARPTLLDLAGRSDLREAARDWQHRIDVCTAETDHRPADALLIRPDAHIAWAAATGEAGLREGLVDDRARGNLHAPILDRPATGDELVSGHASHSVAVRARSRTPLTDLLHPGSQPFLRAGLALLPLPVLMPHRPPAAPFLASRVHSDAVLQLNDLATATSGGAAGPAGQDRPAPVSGLRPATGTDGYDAA